MENTMGNIQNKLSNTFDNTKDSLSSMYNNVSSSASENFNKVSENTSSITNNVYDKYNTFKDSVSDTVNDFSSKNVGEASNEFLQSNSLIARFSFVFIVVILFMILLRIGIFLVGYFTETKKNPYIIKGLLPGSQPATIAQDPKYKDSTTILRSNNEKTGIEFSWCVWLNISNIITDKEGYHHIFNKGDNIYNKTGKYIGVANTNNGPGLYISNSSDPTLYLIMNTVSETNPIKEIKINNIPLKKWFHLILRMQNNVMDIYINGVATQRVKFEDVPKQNYQDIYVCQDNTFSNGFSGYLSDLRYYNRALNIFEITNIVSSGPNLTTSNLNSSVTNYGSTYLSSIWYTNKM
jgi:hypothetical protein